MLQHILTEMLKYNRMAAFNDTPKKNKIIKKNKIKKIIIIILLSDIGYPLTTTL